MYTSETLVAAATHGRPHTAAGPAPQVPAPRSAVPQVPPPAPSPEAPTGLELRKHLGVLRRRWRLAATATLLCVGLAAGGSALTAPRYAATTDLFVSAQSGEADASTAYQGGLLSQQRVQSYVKLVTSPAVAEAVATRLELEEHPDALRQRIRAEAAVNTVLISIHVMDTDPVMARRLADAVAWEFTRLVQRLEAPVGTGEPPVQVRVVQPARVPLEPVSPDVLRTGALGLLFGLLLGGVLAFLREALDSSLRAPEDVEEHLGRTPLGVIAHDEQVRARPLIVSDTAHSPRSEAFRHLRTNLQFVDVDNAPRSIIVTSAMASEGKSTTACNLAISLSQGGLRVCLVDADLRRPQVATYLGIEGAVGVTSVLAGTADLDDVLQEWGPERIAVLPAGAVPPNPAELLASGGMAQLLRTLEARYDLVLLDTAPVLPVTDTSVLSTVADGALVVVRAGRTSREQARRCLQSLRSVGGRVYGVVLVGASASGRDAYAYGYGGTEVPNAGTGAGWSWGRR